CGRAPSRGWVTTRLAPAAGRRMGPAGVQTPHFHAGWWARRISTAAPPAQPTLRYQAFLDIMRIAAVHGPDGKIFGTCRDDQFRPLSAGGAPVRDLRLVIAWLEERSGALQEGAPQALADVKLAAPVGPLGKNVICVGKNYYDHAQEFARSGVDQSGDKQEAPADPVVFTKATTSLADPFQPIPASSDPTHSVDYEGELGVVIARRCRNVKRAAALAEVFGYTIVNDVTARTLQHRHRQSFLRKILAAF